MGHPPEKVKEPRELLIESLRTHLLPVLIEKGFECAPLARRGPMDREFVLTLPLGRLRREREEGVDLVEIDFARNRHAAFRINIGVAPSAGLMTPTGHWSARDIYVEWLNEFFIMYAFPGWRIWFFDWLSFLRSPIRATYDKLAMRVAGLVPEIELALREGRLGPHMRRIVVMHPALWVPPADSQNSLEL
jgi:hypothetical protein